MQWRLDIPLSERKENFEIQKAYRKRIISEKTSFLFNQSLCHFVVKRDELFNSKLGFHIITIETVDETGSFQGYRSHHVHNY